MSYVSIYKGILFIERTIESATTLKKIEYKKFSSYNAQIQTLDCVKDQLAEKTISLGGNAVINFTYGQKSCDWFKSMLLCPDGNVKWFGSGFSRRSKSRN